LTWFEPRPGTRPTRGREVRLRSGAMDHRPPPGTGFGAGTAWFDCRHCGAPVKVGDATCPTCGRQQRSAMFRSLPGWVPIAIAVAAVALVALLIWFVAIR